MALARHATSIHALTRERYQHGHSQTWLCRRGWLGAHPAHGGGPAGIGTTLSQTAAPIYSNVQRTAEQWNSSISSVLGQAPRPALAAGPAVATAPVGAQQAAGQSAADTTARVYQENRPSVVTVISSVVQPGFRSEPQPADRFRIRHRRSGPHPDQQPRRLRG